MGGLDLRQVGIYGASESSTAPDTGGGGGGGGSVGELDLGGLGSPCLAKLSQYCTITAESSKSASVAVGGERSCSLRQVYDSSAPCCTTADPLRGRTK